MVERLVFARIGVPQADLRTQRIDNALPVGRPDSLEPAESGQLVLYNQSEIAAPDVDAVQAAAASPVARPGKKVAAVRRPADPLEMGKLWSEVALRNTLSQE